MQTIRSAGYGDYHLDRLLAHSEFAVPYGTVAQIMARHNLAPPGWITSLVTVDSLAAASVPGVSIYQQITAGLRAADVYCWPTRSLCAATEYAFRHRVAEKEILDAAR